MPNAPECQPIADQVVALTIQEQAKREQIATLAGVDKWKALQELGTIRQQLADQQTALRDCEKQHTADLAITVVVMDVGNVGGPNRLARLWQLTSAGQAVKQTATVQDGVAKFAALATNQRQSFGLTVEQTDQSVVNGPDFRSGPLPLPSADRQQDPITRIEIVILDPIVIDPASLTQAVPPLPIPFSFLGGLFGTINLSITGLSFSITNGTVTISANGTAAGVGISSPFTFAAMLHVAPTFGMAPSTLLEVSPQGKPTLSMPGIVGTVVSSVSDFLWPELQTATVQPLNTLLNKMLADHVATSLGLRAVPSGSVLSIRQLEVDGNTLKLTPALGAFGTILTSFQPPAPDAVAQLLALELQPTEISTSDPANRVAQGRVTLTNAAPAGGVTVVLSSDKPQFAHIDPATLVIVEGQSQGMFALTAIAHAVMAIARVDATITATMADQTLTASISIKPEPPVTLTDVASSFTSAQTRQLEFDILQGVNQYRRSKGLVALVPDDACATQARAHSVDMAAGRLPLGHDGFMDRSAAIGLAPGHPPGSAEQVAAGQQSAADVVQAWSQEKAGGTLYPVEGPYTMAGVGAARSQDGMNFFTILYA